jgi:hypothetical protein
MPYSCSDLRAAADAGIITAAQLDSLLAFLGAERPAPPQPDRPRFDIVHVLWYAGALIVMAAMGLFSTLAFSRMGGLALTATALAYAALFTAAGHYLWAVQKLRTPGGLLIAVAVSMAPLAVYGLQDAFGLWSQPGWPGVFRGSAWGKGSWVFMELAAIVASAIALRFYRFPFLTFIMAIALWFLSMDLAQWIAGKPHDWEIARRMSIGFGLGVIVAAMIVNARQRTGDFAYWLYLFGVITFWGGITAAGHGSMLEKTLYCAMNVAFLLIAVFLGRQVFAVFGALGVAIYLGDLASEVFKDSMMFPFALSLIGVAIIALGLWYYRRQDAINAWFDGVLPAPLKRLRPREAG